MLWFSLQTMNLILTSLEREDIGLANHRCVVIELAHQDNQLRETVRIQRCTVQIMASSEIEVMNCLANIQNLPHC